MPKIPKLNLPKFDFLSKLSERMLGEKPPSPEELSTMIKNATAASAAFSQTSPTAADMEKLKDEVKKETQSILNKQVSQIESMTSQIKKQAGEAYEMSVQNKERMDDMERNMKKFLSLYELVTNQVNPFVDQLKNPFDSPPTDDKEEDEKPKQKEAAEKKILSIITTPAGIIEEQNTANLKPIIEPELKIEVPKTKGLDNVTPSIDEPCFESDTPEEAVDDLDETDGLNVQDDIFPENNKMKDKKDATNLLDLIRNSREEDVDLSSDTGDGEDLEDFEETITLKNDENEALMEELKNILPLKSINNDFCSLVTTLNWLKYLRGKAGTTGALDILRGYRVLGWITPEICSLLMKYMESITGKVEEKEDLGGTETEKYVPTVDDHLNSLFFIAKLKGIHMNKDDFKRIVRRWNIAGGDSDGS